MQGGAGRLGRGSPAVTAEIYERLTNDQKSAPSGGADWPPSWTTKPHGISVGRYTDPAFARLEHEKLWRRVWQPAARLDEIPEVGDYTTYTIGDQSVMLVRADESTVKAYHNFCPHRGTALSRRLRHVRARTHHLSVPWLALGSAGQQQVRARAPGVSRRSAAGQRCCAAAKCIRVVFAGFVWINLSKNPEPFDDYIAPVRSWLEDLCDRPDAQLLVEGDPGACQLEGRAGSVLRGLPRSGHASAAGESRRRSHLGRS